MHQDLRLLTAADIAHKQNLSVVFASPDSKFLYYVVSDPRTSEQILFQAEIASGISRKVRVAEQYAHWVPLWDGHRLDFLCERNWHTQTATFWRVSEDCVLDIPSERSIGMVHDVQPIDGYGFVITTQRQENSDHASISAHWREADVKIAWANYGTDKPTALALVHDPSKANTDHSIDLKILRSTDGVIDGVRIAAPISRVIVHRSSPKIIVLTDLSEATELAPNLRRQHWKNLQIIDVDNMSRSALPDIVSCHSFDWAPSCERGAFLVTVDGKAKLALLELATCTSTLVVGSDVPISEHGAWVSGAWVDGSNFAIDGAQCISNADGKWVLVDASGLIRALHISSNAFQAPKRCGHLIIALNCGLIYRLDLESGQTEQLPIPEALHVEHVISPTSPRAIAQDFLFIARNTDDDLGTDSRSLYKYSVDDAESIFLISLDGGWPHVEGALDSPLCAWVVEGDSGTKLFAQEADRSIELASVNSHFNEIRRGFARVISYTDEGGNDLCAYLIYPPDHTHQKLATIVAIFPWFNGHVADPPAREFWAGGFTNLHIAAAQGYLVVVPAQPPKYNDWPQDEFAERKSKDRYSLVVGGVDAILRKLIESGETDPDRIAVMGWSGGATAALRLLADSDKPKVGIVISPVANSLASHIYAHHEQRHAYSHIDGFSSCKHCDDQDRTPDHYYNLATIAEQSAIRYSCSVKCPLLIVQGDNDQAELNHSSTLYEAMVKLGRKTALVRYAGEGHGIVGSANVIDFWDKALKWLETNLHIDGTGR